MKYRVSHSSLYAMAAEEIDAIYRDMKVSMEMASQEGLNSNFFGRFLVSVADSLAGVATTFVSNIAKCTKSIKRSELHEFVDSNRLRVKTVDNIPYSRLVGFQVDIPANLNGTYKNAISNIAQVYVKLNAANTAKLLLNTLTNIHVSLLSGDGKTSGLISSAYSVISSVVNASKQVVLDCQRNFSGKFQQKAKFDDVFLSKEEWVECQSMMLELEPRLQEAKALRETVERMETMLKNILTEIGDTPEKLSQKDVTNFGETVKQVALVMDGYNLAVTRQLALEHNYVLMINAIYAGVR